MSADNYILIRKATDGNYAVSDESMSSDKVSSRPNRGEYLSFCAAYEDALGMWSEYGVVIDDRLESVLSRLQRLEKIELSLKGLI